MAQNTLTRPKIEKICEVCKTEFFVYPYRAKTARFCSHACYATTVHKQEKTEKWYEVMKGRTPWNKGLKGWCEEFGAGFPKGNQYGKGEKNVNWKGGITPLYRAIRACHKYSEWRAEIFERDNYTCQECGLSKSNKLNVHHTPKSFAQILADNNIQTIDEALVCKELWDTENNQVLCLDCHKKTETYGTKGILANLQTT